MSRAIRKGSANVCLDGADSNGVGTEVAVAPYRHIMVAIIGHGSSPTGTVKCQGSLLMSTDANLDFSSAASVTNIWDFIAMWDMEDNSLIAGDTGIAFAGTGDVRILMVNTDGLRTLNFQLSSVSGGEFTVRVFPMASA